MSNDVAVVVDMTATVDDVRSELFHVHCLHQQTHVVHPKISRLCRIVNEQLSAGNNTVSSSNGSGSAVVVAVIVVVAAAVVVVAVVVRSN